MGDKSQLSKSAARRNKRKIRDQAMKMKEEKSESPCSIQQPAKTEEELGKPSSIQQATEIDEKLVKPKSMADVVRTVKRLDEKPESLSQYLERCVPEFLQDEKYTSRGLKRVDELLLMYVRDIMRGVISRMKKGVIKGDLDPKHILVKDDKMLLPCSMSDCPDYKYSFPNLMIQMFGGLIKKGCVELDDFIRLAKKLKNLDSFCGIFQHPFLFSAEQRYSYPVLAVCLLKNLENFWMHSYNVYLKNVAEPCLRKEYYASLEDGFRQLIENRTEDKSGCSDSHASNLLFVRNAYSHWGECVKGSSLTKAELLISHHFPYVLLHLHHFLEWSDLDMSSRFFN